MKREGASVSDSEIKPINDLMEAEQGVLLKEAVLTPSQWVSNPYITAATSDNTRKAYRSDIRHFEQWGGQLPATSQKIVLYLQAFATTLNPRTLSRRLIALKQWHVYQGFSDPTQHPLVQKTLVGLMRVHGKPKNKARALTPQELLKIASYLLGDDSLIALRDNALLQIGYFGAFRRSELVQIGVEHLQWKEEGVEIVIPNSKTDPLHEGQVVAVPFGKSPLCAVTALKTWLSESEIQKGVVFRRILRSEKMGENALAPLSVNHILQKWARICGLNQVEQLSSHSLRRGLATSASRAGAGIQAIQRQGRWRSVNTVMEYIEEGERFVENAAASVLKKFPDIKLNRSDE